MQVQMIQLAAMTLVAAFASEVTAAKEQPDFSGTWKMLGHSEESLYIVQDANGLLVTRRTEFGESEEGSWQVDLRYAFSGAQTWSSWVMPDGREWIETARAHWVDEALQIDIRWDFPRGESSFSETYYINEDQQLVRALTATDLLTGMEATSRHRFVRVVP